ncbi:hypothetical protein H4582DRAFT_2066074 [Lactarius indigo]|nr:hypothetical protein H4582DRAFT_2066074 [Lactarius indigo]
MHPLPYQLVPWHHATAGGHGLWVPAGELSMAPFGDMLQILDGLPPISNTLQLARHLSDHLSSLLSVAGEDHQSRPQLWESVRREERNALREVAQLSVEADVQRWCDEFVTTTHGMAIDDAVTSLITMLQVADQEDLSAHALTCIAIACVAWEPDHKHHIAEQKAAWMAEVAEQQRTAAIQEGE